MCRRLFLLFSFVVVLSLASITYGDYVISDFNNPDDPNDGWALVDPNNPNIIVTNVDIGDGNSLQITDTTGGGAERAITYSLVAHVNDVNEFRKHTKVSLDLTRLASEWGGPWGGWNELHTAFTGYSEFHLIIEAGRDINDANGPYWEKGWNLLSQRANWGSWNGDYPINFTYDYSTILKEIDFNNLGYLGFTLQTNWGGYTPGGVYYLDNVQLVGEGMAYEPNPANHAVDVQGDSELSWTQGAYADKHDVYFGTSFNDVNDANRASHPGLLCYSEDQEPNYYDPGTLELYTTYYWRIDEVNGLDICKGEVWDFMAAYSGMGVVIGDWENGMNGWKATWQGDTTFSYSTKVDTVTLGMGDYSLAVQTVKLAEPDPGYWIIKRDGVLDLTDMKLQVDVTLLASEWNNEEVIVEPLVVQTDLPHTWSQYLPTAIDRSTGEPVPSFFMPWKSTRGNAYRTYTFDFSDYSDWADANEMTILLALQNPEEGPGNFYLDNARLVNVFLAGNPLPAHLQGNVKKTPTLKWTAGKDATTHDVYFGTDETAVATATRGDPQGVLKSEGQTELTHAPSLLEKDKTYYWRIDEWGATGSPWEGLVWHFTTAEFEFVDDFEDYNDTSNKIQDTWIKGGGGNVGYSNPSYAEVTIVHGDEQSMPFDYNNVESPYDSNASRTFVDLCDWTAFGVKSLSLWVRGWPATVGSWVESSGTHTITASGEDIWDVPDLRGTGYHDEFHYAYKNITGTPGPDVTIIAKVESVSPTDPWAKAGVMIRQSLDPNSTHGFMCITPEMGAAFQHRDTAGGLSTSYDYEIDPTMADVNAPYWVKMILTGTGYLKAYYSADPGTGWGTPIAIISPLPTMPVYVGLAVTAHNPAATCTAEFSNVSITAPGMTISPWSHQDIGIKSNVAVPLYVTLQDDGSVGGDTATVTHTDPNIVLQNTWQAWNIALNDFKVNNPSLNLEKIKKITLGVGPAGPSGTGTLYFDDIGLYLPRCMPSLLRSAVDLTGDCVVDYADLQMIAYNWLNESSGLSHTALGQAQLSTVPEGLKISNIGSSGNDGVRTALPDNITLWRADILDLGDPNDPLNPIPDGAFIEVTSRGIVDGVPDQVVSVVRHEDTGTQVTTTVDFSALEPTSLTANYYLNGELVLTEGNISPDNTGWLGIRWPNDFDITLKWKLKPWWAPWRWRIIIDLCWSYCAPNVQVTTPKGNTVMVDEIHVDAEDIAVSFDGYSDVSLTAADIPSITITDEVLELSTDINNDGAINLKDYAMLADMWLEEILWPPY